MKVTFSAFMGMAPKFDDEQVPDGYATVSHNTKSGRNIMEAWALPQSLGLFGRNDTKSMYKYKNKWFTWPVLTHAAQAPLKNDPYDYVLFVSKGTEPRVVYNLNAEQGTGPYPAVSYPLNVPIPEQILGVVDGDAPTWVAEPEGVKPDPEPEESEYDYSEVAYAICYVDAWGRLSALSDPTDLVKIREWEYNNTTEVELTLPDLPESLLVSDPIRGTTAKTRIYRTNLASSGESVFQFVAEIPATDTTYRDSAYSGDLLDAPLNADWVGAPDLNAEVYPNGAIEKVVAMGADILVGHNKRILCFAEPDAFYAWPVEYYKVFQEDIVTIETVGSSLVVLTTGVPYIVQGVHPSSMDARRLAEPVPCSSAQGSTEVAGAVYFTSETGLYRLEDYALANVSSGFIDSEAWRDLDPTTMILGNYDNKVFVHCPTVNKTYVFDALNAQEGVRTVDLAVESFVELEETNDLAYVDSSTRELKLFDRSKDGHLNVSWESKTYVFNDPTTFNMCKVRANKYPVRIRVEYDHAVTGETKDYIKDVGSSAFFYLPFNARAHRWRVGVESISQSTELEVRDIQLAQSPEEFV